MDVEAEENIMGEKKRLQNTLIKFSSVFILFEYMNYLQYCSKSLLFYIIL